MKPATDGGWPQAVSKRDGTGARIEMGGGNGGTRTDVYVLLSNGSSTYQKEVGSFVTGTWHHWAAVFDGSQSTDATRVKLYIDGVQKTLTFSGTTPTTSATVTDNLRIGNNSNGDIFTGVIDEVRISTSTRSADEVVTDYNTTASPSTFIYLTTEQAAGTTAVDFMGAEAIRFGDGRVFVSWRTGWEVENLGFHVYRDHEGTRHRITPSILCGSLLGQRTGSFLSYGFWDPEPQSSGAKMTYWIEDVDARGATTLNSPVSLEAAPPDAVPRPATGFLSDLRPEPGGGHVVERPAGLDFSSALPVVSALQGSVGARLWPLAEEAATKIWVKDDGWYRADAPTLHAAGLAADTDPRHLALFLNGREQAIRVAGEEDGRLDDGDFVEFYGRGRDEPHGDASAYWLMVTAEAGLRLAQAPAVAASSLKTGRESFPLVVTRKDRAFYVAALRNGPTSNFFGQIVAGKPVELTMEVHHRAAADAAAERLEVVLQGLTLSPHAVDVQLNGTSVGTITFTDRERGTLDVPVSVLRDGTNTVRLARGANEMDVSLVDFVRLAYRHALVADTGGFTFTATGPDAVPVRGLAAAGVRAIDVTSPDKPEELVVSTAAGTGAATIAVPGSGLRRIFLFSEGDIRRPGAIEPHAPTSLVPSGGADLVIVSHPDFLASLGPLVELRRRQGFRVALVDVTAIYDAFSYGHKDPEAIRSFLGWARSDWERAPRFVLLAGDGTFDPRNFLGTGRQDFIPPALVDTDAMETASDDWFVDFDADERPDMAIGRLPLRTRAEADAVVAKIVGWRGVRGDFSNDLLMIAGTDPTIDFPGYNSATVKALPPEVRRMELAVTAAAATEMKEALLRALRAGSMTVNYFGHGSVELWDPNRFMTTALAKDLDNGPRQPVFLLMTCLNGFFQDVYTDSLGETLLRAPNGGGVAAFASSTQTLPDEQHRMDQALLAAMFSKRVHTLGEAVLGAKAATEDRDVRRSWVLLGDPSMPLDPDAQFSASGEETMSAPGTIDTTTGCACRVPGRARGGSPHGAVLVMVLLGLIVSRRVLRGRRRR